MNSAARILVLGATGMLGHKLLQVRDGALEVFGTVRSAASLRLCRRAMPDVPADRFIAGVDALNFSSVRGAVESIQPEVVVNCIGVVKQSDAMQDAATVIQLNALLPHQLAQLCGYSGARLIHFSTDCVFSGRRGNYSESDPPDPVDLYGSTKLLGEVDQPGCLTLRTSIVGWELQYQRSLFGWFTSQRGKRIRGYRRAIYSGLTTGVMANLVATLIRAQPRLSGIYHVASAPITKFDLLCALRDALGWTDTEIEPDDSMVCDRSLSAAGFQKATGWTAPAWGVMIAALAREHTMYERGVLQG